MEENHISAAHGHPTGGIIYKKDENKFRGNWTNKFDFVLSLLSYAVGLGNVWRFPTKVYENGGGAFFIPYFTMLFLAGIPVFFLEVGLGQFSSSGPLTCWTCAPIFQGIGYATVIVTAITCTYYNVIIAWSLFFFAKSFTTDLPWQHCDRPWNSDYCFDKVPDVNCSSSGLGMYDNGTCYNGTTLIGIWNETRAREKGIIRKTAAEEFYNNYILKISPGITQLGGLRWQNVLCLLAAWVIVFLALSKGVKTFGKAAYFTSLYPYVMLIALLARALTLKGYQEGIYYYLRPDWSLLGNAKVWSDAGTQIFYSLSVGFGGLIALSSYNRFHNNCLRDAIVVSMGNCITSILAGFVVFSYLGLLANETGKDVKDVVTGGFGLVFVVYPDAITRMPGFTPAWAVFFFVMLLTLGMGSQFAMVENLATCIMDKLPAFLERRGKSVDLLPAFLSRHLRTVVLFCICAVCFVGGLACCTNGGLYVLQLLDAYVGGWSLLTIGLCECVALMGVYGWKRFAADIQAMLGFQTFIWWRICWSAVSPLILLFVLVFALSGYGPVTYGTYVFPTYANVLSWIAPFLVVLPIPLMALLTMFCWSGDGSIRKKFKIATSPTEDWGPALEEHRRLAGYPCKSDQIISTVEMVATGYSRERYTPFQYFTNKGDKGDVVLTNVKMKDLTHL